MSTQEELPYIDAGLDADTAIEVTPDLTHVLVVGQTTDGHLFLSGSGTAQDSVYLAHHALSALDGFLPMPPLA